MGWIVDANELDKTLNILSNHSLLNCSLFGCFYAIYKIILKLLDKNFKCITDKIKIVYEGK